MHKMPPMINLAESCRDALAAPSSKANTFADCQASTLSQTVRNRSAAHCCTDINMDHHAFWQCRCFTAMLVQQRHVREAYWQYCRDGLAPPTNHAHPADFDRSTAEQLDRACERFATVMQQTDTAVSAVLEGIRCAPGEAQPNRDMCSVFQS